MKLILILQWIAILLGSGLVAGATWLVLANKILGS